MEMQGESMKVSIRNSTLKTKWVSGRHRIYLAAAVTLFGMGGLGLLLMIVFHEQTFSNFFPARNNLFFATAVWGIVWYNGGPLAVAVTQIALKNTGQFFRKLLLRYRVGWLEIIMISVSAWCWRRATFFGVAYNHGWASGQQH